MAKNKHYENKFKGQRQYGSRPNQRFKNGIMVYHVYDGKKELSWWDDTAFNLNGRRIMIWWTHPRMEFSDAISDTAYTNIPCPYEDKLFKDSEKIYKYVGKSGKRKKVYAYRANPADTAENRKKWYDALKQEEVRLQKESDITIKPFIKVEMLKWCRGVSICCPIEVRGEADLHILCNLVKRLLKGETTLDKEFPDYKYTKDDWAREQVPESVEFHGHTIA